MVNTINYCLVDMGHMNGEGCWVNGIGPI